MFCVSLLVTTRQKPTKDTQNIKESKEVTSQSHQLTKIAKEEKKIQRKYITVRKQ